MVHLDCFYTMIYAFNDKARREELSKALKKIKINTAWLIYGDFNCVMNPYERLGSLVREVAINDIRECMNNECSMIDINVKVIFTILLHHFQFSLINIMVKNLSCVLPCGKKLNNIKSWLDKPGTFPFKDQRYYSQSYKS